LFSPDTSEAGKQAVRAIVSTISIPNHLLRYKAGSATDQSVGGQFWTPIPRLMEWAPRGGRDQASGLTVCRVCCFSNCIGLI
jgi:hypothetical protein